MFPQWTANVFLQQLVNKKVVPIACLAFAPPIAVRKTFPKWFRREPPTQLCKNGCSHCVFRVCSDTTCSKTHVPTVDCQCVPTTPCQTNFVPITVLALAPGIAFRKTSSHSGFGKRLRHSLAKNACSRCVLCMCSYRSCSKMLVPIMVFQYVRTIACHTTVVPMTRSAPCNKKQATSNAHPTNNVSNN